MLGISPPILEDELDGRDQAAARFILCLALAVRLGHFGAERDHPVAFALEQGRELIAHVRIVTPPAAAGSLLSHGSCRRHHGDRPPVTSGLPLRPGGEEARVGAGEQPFRGDAFEPGCVLVHLPPEVALALVGAVHEHHRVAVAELADDVVRTNRQSPSGEFTTTAAWPFFSFVALGGMSLVAEAGGVVAAALALALGEPGACVAPGVAEAGAEVGVVSLASGFEPPPLEHQLTPSSPQSCE